MRVLVIEDDKISSFILQRRMEKEGLATRFVRSLSEAKNTPGKFDVVLSDVYLPDSRGIEDLTTLYESFPRSKLICMSANKIEGTIYKCSGNIIQEIKKLIEGSCLPKKHANYFLKKVRDSRKKLEAVAT